MEKQRVESFIISQEEAGIRLDKVLAERFSSQKSRAYFQDLIEKGCVYLNQHPIKKRTSSSFGDRVDVYFPENGECAIFEEEIPLSILYEDEALIVINKPAGMVVHPACGHSRGTVVNALMHHCKDAFTAFDIDKEDPLMRPGIVHRLDKDTSGVMVAAKSPMVAEKLIALFANRKVKKEYIGICVGNPGNCTIDVPIGRHPVRRKEQAVLEEGGKTAVTQCEVIAFDGKLSKVRMRPITGRMHQLRVHLKHRRTPILGDPLYGCHRANRQYGALRQLLHAESLTFDHPITGKSMRFVAELPIDFGKFLSR